MKCLSRTLSTPWRSWQSWASSSARHRSQNGISSWSHTWQLLMWNSKISKTDYFLVWWHFWLEKIAPRMSAFTSSCCLSCYQLSILRQCLLEFRQLLTPWALCLRMQMARSASPAATLTTSSNWCITKSSLPQVSRLACRKSRSNWFMSSFLTHRTSQTHNDG